MTVGRFQVMSVLQAARAYVLGLPLESSYSWGLNRAIFIAAAKRGFKGSAAGGGRHRGSSKEERVYRLGDDMAYKTEREGVVLFTIGGKVQTAEEFDRRVKARFGSAFPSAWREALAYIRTFDGTTLHSGEEFYSLVYRPVRDQLAERWTEASSSANE